MLSKKLIEKYKVIRKTSYLNKLGNYRFSYAFAGVGHHSISNLYPCLESLRVPLKYIYSRNLTNANKLSRHFQGCTATAEINDLLSSEVKGIFICTQPSKHYDLVINALHAGKCVFVEKPPCQSSAQLKKLIDAQGNNICMVALQRRFSTINRLLKRHRLTRHASSYVYRYCTGSYPEGDAITELFIHPIDNAVQLFGDIHSFQVQKIVTDEGLGFHLLIKHQNSVQGILELSTDYSWSTSFEILEINTKNHLVYANYPNELRAFEKPGTILNVPAERVFAGPLTQKVYFNNNGFIPGATQNSLVVQGFYPEIKHFLSLAETGNTGQWSDLKSLHAVYAVLDHLTLID